MEAVRRGSRARRALFSSLLAATMFGTLAAPASATFHLTMLREIYAGGSGINGAADEYVEIQAYEPLQNRMGGRVVSLYEADGTRHDVTIPADVPKPQSQRTTLLATAGAQARFGVEPDATIPTASLDPFAGAVCFEVIDCVTWGSYTGPTMGPAGDPAATIPVDSALRRTIGRGCPSLLDPPDDTDDSAADFSVVPDPDPRPNLAPVEETRCPAPATRIDSGPRKRTSSNRARFRFSSPTEGARFDCSLDDSRFKRCGSPRLYRRIERGFHTFAVRAVRHGVRDHTPAEYRWKRKR
jgi:hypothetical protein